LQFNPYLR
jgi:hypothetical protein